MRPMEFDVLWWDSNQAQLNDLGIRPDINNADTRQVLFFTIDNISPYFETEKDYTTICSGGEEYIIAKPYNEVKQILNPTKK